MKFSVNGGDLINAFKMLGSAVSTKPVNPVLGCVRIRATESGKLELTTMNEETIVRGEINANINTSGEFLTEFSLLNATLKGLDGEELTFDKDGDKNVTIYYGASKLVLQIVSGTFPNANKKQEVKLCEVEPNDLRNLISKSTIAVATDNTRPILKGVLFETNNNTINAVSLDGYRLVTYRINASIELPNQRLVLPSNTLDTVYKLLDQKIEKVIIYSSETSATFEIGKFKISSRLINGDYIEYRKIIPSEFSTTMIIQKEQLYDTLLRVSQISKRDAHNKISTRVESKEVVTYAESEVGEIEERLQCEVQGEGVDISFNAKFVLDFLKTLDDEFIKISFNNAQTPFIITARENGNYIYLVLPVRRG